MDFNILGVVTFLVGIIFVYSGIKGFYPQDVVKHALGGPEPKKIGGDKPAAGSGDPGAAGGAAGGAGGGGGDPLGNAVGGGHVANPGVSAGGASIGPAIAAQNGGNHGQGFLGAVGSFAARQFRGIAAGAKGILPHLFGK